MTKDKLTIAGIRRAVRTLKKHNVAPIGKFYFGEIRRGALIDILLSYKRPRSTKLYKSMRLW